MQLPLCPLPDRHHHSEFTCGGTGIGERGFILRFFFHAVISLLAIRVIWSIRPPPQQIFWSQRVQRRANQSTSEPGVPQPTLLILAFPPRLFFKILATYRRLWTPQQIIRINLHLSKPANKRRGCNPHGTYGGTSLASIFVKICLGCQMLQQCAKFDASVKSK